MAMLSLVPVTKQIIWGGERLSRDFDIGKAGEKIAEAWELTCRNDGDNEIAGGEYGGTLLSSYLAAHPQALGKKWDGKRFPLLIKLIDAQSDLSIQVHPDDEYAAAHTDDLGKTEMWYIVDALPGAKIIYGMKKNYSRGQIEQAIAEGKLEDMMNYVPVKKGETYFIPSGLVHAICAGCLIAEIQQNSNVTYRVYDYNRRQPDGSLRQLHVAQALDVIGRFDPEAVKSGHKENIIAECKYFTVRLFEIGGTAKLTAGEDSFVHLLCVDGTAELVCGNEKISIKKGGSVFAAACSGEIGIVSENAKIIASSM